MMILPGWRGLNALIEAEPETNFPKYRHIWMRRQAEARDWVAIVKAARERRTPKWDERPGELR
jgi:hypothetical protein